MLENSFRDSSFVDVLLDFDSSGNLVVNEGEPRSRYSMTE